MAKCNNLQTQVYQNQQNIKALEFGLNVVGRVENVPDLPQTAKLGEAYLVGKEYPYYIYIRTADKEWTNMGTLVSTVPGPQGEEGDKGDKGDPGAVWYTGSHDPEPEFVANDGDLYLNRITGALFQKKDGKWGVPLCLIIGPAGPQGLRGWKGDKGDKGDAGPQGQSGPVFVLRGRVATFDELPDPATVSLNSGYAVGDISSTEVYMVALDSFGVRSWVSLGTLLVAQFGEVAGTSYEGNKGKANADAIANLTKDKADVAMVEWGFGPEATNKNQFYGKVGQVFVNQPTQSIYMYGTPEELTAKFFDIWGMPEGFKATHVYVAIKPLSNKSSRVSFKMYLSSSNYGKTHEMTVEGYNGAYLSDSGWINTNMTGYCKVDGLYTRLISGETLDIINPLGKKIVKGTFVERPIANGQVTAESGIAVVNAIGGNTIVVNQLVNKDNIISTSSYLGVTFTNNKDGTITVNGTSERTIRYGLIRDGFKTIIKHKYLLMGNNINNPNIFLYVETDKRDYGDGLIFEAEEVKSVIGIGIDGINTISNEILHPQLIDLTQWFGAGNEPTTIEQFKAMCGFPEDADIHIPYDLGTIMSAKPSQLKSLDTKGAELDVLNTQFERYFYEDVMRGVKVKQSNGAYTEARDSLTSSHAVKVMEKFNLYDLPASSWVIQGGGQFDVVFTNNKPSKARSNVVANAICNKFTVISSNDVNNHNIDKTIGTYNVIIKIYNSEWADITDKNVLKEKLKDTYLIYELKNPEFMDVNPIRPLSYVGVRGGTEKWNLDPTGLTVPVATEIAYEDNMGYKLAKLDDQTVTDAKFAEIDRRLTALENRPNQPVIPPEEN